MVLAVVGSATAEGRRKASLLTLFRLVLSLMLLTALCEVAVAPILSFFF